MFRKLFVAVPVVVMAIGGSTACASKKFVRTSVGEVNEKVDSQGRAIEETQDGGSTNAGIKHFLFIRLRFTAAYQGGWPYARDRQRGPRPRAR